MANDYIDQWNANGVPYDIHDKGRAQPNGVATLDSNGRIPYSQLPESAVELKGYWNASTNTPTLVDGTGNTGDEYYVDTAGTQNLGSGPQYFDVGDRVLYINGVWKNINSSAVNSVNGVLPNAQGDVDILSKVYPVGSIYQNATSPANPATLFGIGHWTQITDRFLVCANAGSFYEAQPTFMASNDYGSTFSYTLADGNMPKHRHYMDHTHGTVAHTHTRGSMEITAYAEFADVSSTQLGIVSAASGAIIKGSTPSSQLFASGVGSAYAQQGYSLDFAASRSWIGETSSAAPDTGTASIAYTDWSGYDNPTAITIVPSYRAVYTWYRDS